MATFKEIEKLDLSALEKEISRLWQAENTFKNSVQRRAGNQSFNFYEGPPTANGKPGIHHVLGRTIKDVFCRFRTLKGFYVERKGGWDTHGLPVEIEIEKKLGIKNKTEIEKYGIEKFNRECKNSVLKYKDDWDELTKKLGYWVYLENPYITFDNNYIESVWWLVKELHKRKLLYKGHKIQWYSPGSGTVLSSHEVSLGYKEIIDPSVYVLIKLLDLDNTYLLIWTTTPWTLPSNVAIAINPNIDYALVQDDQKKIFVAASRANSIFSEPKIIKTLKGSQISNISYEPLYKIAGERYSKSCFKTYTADYVTAEDGSGAVHIAPAFGAEDNEVGKLNNLTTIIPVNQDGYFNDKSPEFIRNKWFKDADLPIIKDLKIRGLLYKKVAHKHNYPFDWRKGTHLLSYPVNSWFIKTSSFKDQLVSTNKDINWYPKNVRDGRFGKWLENNVDWALSRKRYWGTPLPIWESIQPDSKTYDVIGSISELKEKAKLSDNYKLELHRPYVDEIIIESNNGERLKRVPDVLDVWFDSGAMPYAQWHYPFENKESFSSRIPADFICEGIDQTRGWFYTMHAISVLLTGKPIYKNVVVNGLVLDENGEKMSKSKGNTIDPLAILNQFGVDVVRWYLISNSSPWDDMKFSYDGLKETRNKIFGTLENVYRFFSVYANIDSFEVEDFNKKNVQFSELDHWLISRMNSTLREVNEKLTNYDCTTAARSIETFIDELSNWYIRRSRERFWAGKKVTDSSLNDKLAAYIVTRDALMHISIMMSPFAPFFSDWLFRLLNPKTNESVHLQDYPEIKHNEIHEKLESRIQYAREIVQLVLLIRNREKLNVRQPLKKVTVVVDHKVDKHTFKAIESIILKEVNVKTLELESNTSGLVKKKAKADFKLLGPKHGSKMKELANKISQLEEKDINDLLKNGLINIKIGEIEIPVSSSEVTIISSSIEGLSVAQEGTLTVALDTTLDENLIKEGAAREFINRVQSIRKNKEFNLTDRILINVMTNSFLEDTIVTFSNLIKNETLANEIKFFKPKKLKGENHQINGAQIIIEVVRQKSH